MSLCSVGALISFGAVWCYLLFSIWSLGRIEKGPSPLVSESPPLAFHRGVSEIRLPPRFRATEALVEPPSLEEIARNVSVYLTTLHETFRGLQGRRAVPVDIWEAYLNVTKSTVMKWDDENRNRFPRPRRDNSIFVSLGTYRGIGPVRSLFTFRILH